MSISRSSLAYTQIRENLQGLLSGVVVSIDPSIGSVSSMPGYAVYRAQELVASGTFTIPPDRPVWYRLRLLASHMRKLYREYDPDVLVYEEIPSKSFGYSNVNSHASLLKAVGVILSVPGPAGYVGLFPLSWKKLVRSTYVKGDETDAIEIGYIAVTSAAEIATAEEARKARERNRRQRRAKA